jgi:diacylglycerol kinase family enzyme
MGRVAHLERSLGLLIVNPHSGTGAPSAAELKQEAARKGLGVHVLADGDDAQQIAREATGPNDIGLDRSAPVGALAAFGSSRERLIDVGRVGTRTFLNNVSSGRARFGYYCRREPEARTRHAG